MTGAGAGGTTAFTALILAASRPDDPVARHCGVSHKALVPVGGVPMVARVADALTRSGPVERLAVCIEDRAILRGSPPFDDPDIRFVAADRTPSRSVLRAIGTLGAPYPLLVTTADHALLSPEIVRFFCAGALESGADIVAGLASASVIRRDHPTTRRTFLPFRDDGYSGCNLFALLTPRSLDAVQFWTRAEQDRKQPFKLIGHFGLGPLLLFALRRLSLDEAMQRASRRIGARVAAVKMPFAEAAIDVDKPADLELVQAVLRGRGQTAG